MNGLFVGGMQDQQVKMFQQFPITSDPLIPLKLADSLMSPGGNCN